VTEPSSGSDFEAHERLAWLAIEVTDRMSGGGDNGNLYYALEELIDRADSPPLLLALAIAFAQDRATDSAASPPSPDSS